jgi:hypothetical protein
MGGGAGWAQAGRPARLPASAQAASLGRSFTVILTIRQPRADGLRTQLVCKGLNAPEAEHCVRAGPARREAGRPERRATAAKAVRRGREVA